jgi:flagellar export protein FliJ
MPFKFKLSPVLRQRQLTERQKQRDYALTLAAVKNLQDQLTNLHQSMDATNTDLRTNRLTGPIDVHFLAAHRRYLLGVQRKAQDLATQILHAQKTAESARIALAEAAKQTKVLEKLREKQQQRWKEDADRKEMIALDEVAMQLTNDPAFKDHP